MTLIDHAILTMGETMRTDTVTVTCRNRECGAQYDARVGVDTLGRDVRWSEPKYNATLPKVCGVCGGRSIVVSAYAHKVRI